jgi:hypothetical protein
MATTKSSNTLSRAHRIELARCANVQIQGLSAELLRMLREQRVDSEAPKHHAALGIVATISDLSDDIFTLVFGDEDDEITNEEAAKITRKLGIELETSHG